MTDPVVGRGQSQTPVPKPKVIANTQLSAGAIASIGSKLSAKGYTVSPNVIEQVGLIDSFKPDQLSVIYKMLKVRGFSPKKSIEDVRAILNENPIMIAIAGRSTDFSSFVNNLESDLLPGFGGDEGAAANVPSRTISEQRPEVLEKLVDTIYKNALGRAASKEEKAARLAEAQAEIAKGTVTTTKQVKNAQTGQLENVTTVTPGFSQTSFEAKTEEALKTLNPDDFDRKKRIDFSSWISQNVAGA